MSNPFRATPFSPDELRAIATADPQATYAAMARECPIHRGPDGTLTLTRMADITALNLRRDVLGPGAHGPMMGAQRPLIPLDLDGPEHLKFRRLLDPLFSARAVALLEPEVRRLADSLIDGFIDHEQADLDAQFCQPLPSVFFLRLLGVPARDLDEFLTIKNAILGHVPAGTTMAERMAAVRVASARCYDYFGRVLDERQARGDPGDDLIGALLKAEVDGLRLTRDNLLDITYLLIIAGLDTVASSLGCMIARLARAPELRRRLVHDPALWPTAVEELLRFESPVPTGLRTPTVDVQIAGETIAAGTTVFLCWSAANLDEEAFPAPLEIDVERRPNGHIAMGSGFHRCLGLHLARMELRVALEQLHRRIPDYSFQPGHELVISGMPRKVNALPLVWP